MKSYRLIALINLLVLGHLSVLCVSQDFDFFYFVQQVLDFPCQPDSINSFRFFSASLKVPSFLYFSIFGCSGQVHTVTQNKVVAIRRRESLQPISGFMVFGQTTTTERIRRTATPTTRSINPRYLHLNFWDGKISFVYCVYPVNFIGFLYSVMMCRYQILGPVCKETGQL